MISRRLKIPLSTISTESKHLEDTTNDRESSQLSENHALEKPDVDKNNHRTDEDPCH